MRHWLTVLSAFLLDPYLGADAAANPSNTEITSSGSDPSGTEPSDSSILDDTESIFIITAKDSLGSLAGDSEHFWVELNKNGTCEIGYGTISCQVLCYPFTEPHVSAKQCESSYHTKGRVTKTSDTALWAVANVESSGSSEYTVTYHESIEVSTHYVVTAYLLTNGGLYGRYWDNVLLTGTESVSGIASEINFQWGSDAAITTYGQDYVSARWEGKILPPYNETYKFYLYADDGARLWIDKQLIIDGWNECCNETWGAVNMTSYTFHDIIVEYREIRGEAYIELRWSSDSIAKSIVPSNYLYYQTHISGSPFDASPIYIAPGDESYQRTYVNDDSPFTGNVAGVSNSVQVTATDAFGHVLDTDDADFDMTDLDGMVTEQQWAGNGVYTITFMADTKTTDSGLPFYIRLGGNDILGSPFTVTVVPAETAPLSSILSGSGLSSATAGYTAQFNITVYDEFGNERESDGDVINVRFYGQAAGHAVCEYLLSGRGIYLCSYTLIETGDYTPEITINGVIHSHSNTITVSSGTIHGPTCDIYNLESLNNTLPAGYAEYLTIQSRDQFGNELTTTTDDYVVNITDGTTAITATVTSMGSGQYNVSFIPTVSGIYQVNMLLDNITHIDGSPYTLTVIPGDPVASTSSVVDGTGYSSAQSDVQSSFVVQIRDAFSNDLVAAVDTDPVFDTAVLECASVDTVISCTYQQLGQYQCTYTPTESGSCSLLMEMSGADISGSPFSVAVSPGEISASWTFAHGITDGMAGVTETFTIQAQDVNGNNLVSGGHTFAAVLVDTHSVYPDVVADITDNTDGTYTAQYVTEDANIYEALNVQLIHFGGLLANYYTDYAFTNIHAVHGENLIDSVLSFDWGQGSPLQPNDDFPASDYFSIRWVGFLYPPYSETYTIYTSIYGGSGVRLYINGDPVIDQFDPLDGESDPFVMIQLTANTLYELQVDFREKTGSSKLSLEWESASIDRTVIDSQYLYYQKNIGGNGNSYDFVSNVSIIPAPTLASACTITGDGLSTSVAGVQSTLSIVAKDQYGNTQTDAGNEEGDFDLYLVDEQSNQIDGVVVDAGNDGDDGLYTATYTITNTSQQYTLYITFGGANVASSPHIVSVTPGILSASQSEAVLLDGRAGETQTFDLYVRDTEGNLIDDRSVAVSLILTHPATSTSITTTDIVDNGNGIYTISYNATLSGVYTPTITMDGTTLTTITSSITISNAIASASKSYVNGWELGADAPIASSTGIQKTIQILDIYSNVLSVTGGYNFYVTLIDSGSSIADQAEVTAGASGTYTIDFTAPSAGTYYLNVMLASGDINTPDGMTGEYFNNRWLHGTPYSTQVDTNCSLDWTDGMVTGTAKNYVSIRWTGYIQPAYAETYTFTISSDDGSALYIDDQVLINEFLSDAGTFTGTHSFATAGLLYPIQIEYRENTGNANFTLEWESSSQSSEVVPQSALFATASHITSSPFTLTVT